MLPLCVFAPVHWYILARHCVCTIDVHEHYVKQTWRNRYEILGANGRQSLTIPVAGTRGLKVALKDIRLAKGSWPRQHREALRSAYGRAPYYEYLSDDLDALFSKRFDFLTDFAMQSHLVLQPFVQLAMPPISPGYIEKPAGNMRDMRGQFDPAAQWPALASYPQVFSDRFTFQPNLSALDLVMNLGLRSDEYITSNKFSPAPSI